MKKVVVLLVSGFEEVEVIVIFDILWCLYIDVEMLVCVELWVVVSYYDIFMVVDSMLSEC